MSLTLKERQRLRAYLDRLDRREAIKRRQAAGELSFFEAQRALRALKPVHINQEQNPWTSTTPA